MNKKIFFLMLIFVLIDRSYAKSENKLEPGYFSNVSKELASPWQPEVRPFLIGGALATLTLVLLEDQIVDPTQQEAHRHRPLGSYNKIGDLGGTFLPNALYSIGMLGSYWISKDQKSLARSGRMFKASAYAIALSSVLKVTIREPRPNKMDRYSFPSGHTTSAFAFATYIVAEHGFFPYGLMATGLASFTALSRMTDNFHYLHDVVAGATIGTAYGLGIGYLYKKFDQSETASQNNVSLMPIYSSETKAIVFSMDF